MAELDKVIKGLDCCLTDDGEYILCEICPYKATDEERRHVDWGCHRDALRNDALELLKEQEAVAAPAVPLDRLCEWLGMHIVPPVSDCLLTTEARTAAWKAVLNKFVEEQDAAD